jgi:hypothetical protein
MSDKPLTQEDIFNQGYKEYLETGKTSQEAYFALINLYCQTNGAFNERFNDKLKKQNPPLRSAASANGVPGNFSAEDLATINRTLNEDGYFHFDAKMSQDVCQRLVKFALTTGAKVPPGYDKKVVYDPNNLLAEIYRFDIQDLVNNTDIQQLMMDPVFVGIARNYLGCEPIFDFPAMWWSTAYKKDASPEAAQLYHFDLDRVKWLKIFFYLNDVTPENGPHCYIEGTHRPGTKSDEILKRGYVRVSDEEIHRDYPESSVKVVCGEAGSMFAGDTKCWHKGTNLKSGHRLVLEFEYASSLFGANYPKMEVKNYTPEFREYCRQNKIFASHMVFNA